ncbi:CPBP family intramembrane metalloprotease [Micrococcales bacterium 31B]|nr:CPBP family intramembrane metalloprotease [Micrococcales bacterium 31B]
MSSNPSLARFEGREVQPRWYRDEIVIVLALSLGASAAYSLVDIVERLAAPTPLGSQTAALNSSYSRSPYFDLAYQLLSLATMLAPVALCIFLLACVPFQKMPSLRWALRSIGCDFSGFGRKLAWGIALAAAIGVPGLGLYAVGRWMGFTVSIAAANLDAYWWTIPILILRAAANGILEEVIMVGYLMNRLPRCGHRWLQSRWGPALTSALIRGSYHFYQGFGGFVGNVVMGLVFTEFYRRKGHTLPLVIAHTLLDIVAFVGYALLAPHWSFLRP